ncbi:MAG TPA: four helix bundle protein [Kiritimatiellia bacterium]|nr:four helix bundle protein [Kiritimatiellia bacterium]HRZ13415.1 four helix bundle protein [Kiritimatiellia bacterium]HSA18945.1 four helix bundle protein [Kiritimatiellia bacterium]
MSVEKPMDLKGRLRDYALWIIRPYCSLSKRDDVAVVLGRQVLRSGTSPGAQHREACRAKSTAEFISKMEGGLQELEETEYWLDLLEGSQRLSGDTVAPLMRETRELNAIFTASIKTAKRRKREQDESA